MTDRVDPVAYNRVAWDREVDSGNEWTRPVAPEVIARARAGDWSVVLIGYAAVPRIWWPDGLAGIEVLCLASGGGQQGPVLAAAGAAVTVLDNSPRQLERDREVATRDDLEVRTVLGDMRDLGVILAGRAASGGGCVVEYDVSSGSMDSGAWPEFHHDAQLSGFYPNTVPVQQYPTAPWSDRLGPRADLVSGSSNNTICSRTGQYCAVLQNSDGNFVFYNGSTACWNSATEGNEGDSLWVQSDGNAVIYSSGGTAIWHSGTSSSYPTTMNVFDGTLYIYEGLEVAADGDNAAAINTADPAWHESC